MWDDATPAERRRALTLAALAALAALAVRRRWRGAVRQPVFALPRGRRRRRRWRAPTRAHLEAVVREELHGHVLHACDLAARARRARAACRGCATRRAAPPVAAIASRSTVEEHEPLARWNDSALVNTHGEVFAADYERRPAALRRARTARAARWSRTLSRVRERARAARRSRSRELRLSRARRLAAATRGPTAARRSSSAATSPTRASRASSPRTRARSARSRAPARASSYVDLRYRNGFAARVPGVPRKDRQASDVTPNKDERDTHGEGQQEPDRRPRHRHVEDRRDRRRGHARGRAQHHRPGHASRRAA